MRYLIIPLILHFFVYSSFAQHPEEKRTNHWYFGGYAGLDFTNSTPVADTNGRMWTLEGCASISDTAGDLLFYTDGILVWNAIHDTMQNGTGLLGYPSSTQSGLIVPKPNNDNTYYIFTVDGHENGFSNGLRYSEVDMGMDGGLGGVTSKNTLLQTPVTEKLTGIHHANGEGIWVLAHEWGNSDFLAYYVDENGVNGVPVRTSIGKVYDGMTTNGIGQIKISPNGKKVAVACLSLNNVELFSFDNSTGYLSNRIMLLSDTADYGVAFSEDNSKLYISTYNNGNSKLTQYNLNAGNEQDIITSKTIIYSSTNLFASLQLGPDGKIYVAEYTPSAGLKGALGVINNPNESGTNCNYDNYGINLAGKDCNMGLPGFIESYFNPFIPPPLPEFENNVFIPNVFSPNQDGNNDVLFVRGNNIEELSFMIYNRWGEKVFESGSIEDGWKGQGQNSGVFVYEATGTFTSGEPFSKKGNITLVR